MTTKVTGMMSTGTKGGDIPSASTLVIDTDGDYFDITGTTGITAMTVDAGRRFTLQFDGALTLTHGSSLYLPGATNFTTEANDCLSFIATAANTVRCTGYALKDGGSPVASAHTGNVAFPATQVASADANTLDDYEQTNWTCTLTDGSNDATGTATGTATKIGRLVVASAYLQTSSLGSVSGSIQMKGLPYASANDGKYHSCAIGYGQGWAYTAGYMVAVHLPPNATTMDMYVFDTSAGATGFQSGEWSDNGQMMITVSYTSA